MDKLQYLLSEIKITKKVTFGCGVERPELYPYTNRWEKYQRSVKSSNHWTTLD
jgi:hypothetical protein